MEETIQVLDIKVEGAVKNVADLRNNVKLLKDHLKELESQTGDSEEKWQEYQQTLDALKANQAALKDVMYATTGTFQDVTKAAVGASESYNGLVNKMAELKREFRATNDEARRMELGTKINDLNTKLKELDALQGNFQRNVGNYQSAFKGLGEKVDVFRKGLGAASGGLNGVKDGLEGISKSPAIATFSILVSIVLKLVDAVKEDERATAALKKGMESLKPVMDFLSGILDKVVDILVEIINKVSAFLGSSGILQKIIQGVMGVGNAILKFVVAPFKGVAAAIKVFQDEGVKGLGNAARAFGNEMKNGVSFKENFKAGQVAADTLLSGMASRKKKAEDTGKALGKEAGKGVAEGMYEEAMKRLKNSENLAKAWREAFASWQKDLDDLQKESMDELTDEVDADFQEQVESLKKALEEEEKLRKDNLEKEKAIAKAKKDLMKSVASNTSDILGSIADLYESDSENAEKNANKIKSLRIAAATIDTISGAVGAFMQASETIPPPYGQIVGAIEAAAITASGIANIAKMKSTKVSTEAGASASPAVTAPAPTLAARVSNVRTITSASEEDRLNRMASDQRVYILSSDIEASQNQIKTQVAEASF